jgi:hypothetical protein
LSFLTQFVLGSTIEAVEDQHMRRILSVAGASLGLHILLFFLSAGYRELAFRVGLLFPIVMTLRTF